ncbi:MAG: beta strand repeat-containing protein [Candidatus Spyradosoma sp.]
MKTSKLLITSLLAAAAMSAPAFGRQLANYTFSGVSGHLGSSGTAEISDNFIFEADSGSTPALTIDNGWQDGSQLYSGKWTGSGTFKIAVTAAETAKSMDYRVSGNLTEYTGNIVVSGMKFSTGVTDLGNTGDSVLQFGNAAAYVIGGTNGAAVSTDSDSNSYVNNIVGTGSITSNTVVRFNYDAADSYSYLKVSNTSISARYLEFKGGANYTVSSTVTGNNTTAANNTLKISAGTTTFTGTVSGFGNVTVASGAALSIGSTGSLDISKGTLSAAGNISIAGLLSAKIGGTNAPISISAGNLSVTDTATFALLGDGAFGESVVLASITGSGTVTAAALSTEKFTYNGHALSSRITGVSLTESGSLAFTGKALSLTWKSDLTTGTWNKSDQNFTASDGTASSFVDYDDVTFATADASVTIGEAIGAEKITISENTTFSASSTNTLSASSVAVGSGKTLTLNGGISSYSFDSVSIAENATLKAIVLAAPTTTPAEGTPAEPTLNTTVDYSGVTGTGTLLLGLRADNGVGFNLSNFTGTIRVEGNTATTRGRLQLNTSTLNSAAQIVVANTGDLVFNGSGTNISNTVTFEGSSSIYVNSSKTGTLSGSLTATSGTLTKEGAGALTLSGRTDINKLIINIGSVTYSAGTHTLGSISASEKTLTVSGASLTISGAATIGTLTQSAGTLNVTAGTTTVGTYGGLRGQSVAGALTIAAGASMSVTGGMTLRWENENTTTLKVNGDLSVGGNLWISRDGNGIVNINDGGTVVAQTLTFGQGWNTTNPTKKSSTVNLGSGGVLVVGAVVANTTAGASGATTSLNTSALNLNGGKLGTSADSLTINVTSGSGNTAKTLSVVLGDGTTSTINTGKYDTATKTFTNTETSISIVNVISGDGALKKAGAGTLTLSGDNTYSGGTTIEGGVLVAGSETALGTNSVRVAGGQLKVSGVTLNSTAITVVLGEAYKTNGGVAALVGESGALAAGTTVTVEASDLSALGLVAGVANDYSIWDPRLSTNAKLELSESFKSLLAAGGWEYVVSSGTLSITAIPEPSVFGLLAGLGALALAGTRRRRQKRA